MVREDVNLRLRRANPDPGAYLADDPLKQRITANVPDWEPRSEPRTSTVRRRHPRRWILSGAAAAATLATILVVSISGRTPDIAQAFPVLNGPSVITPGELQNSIKIYGVSPNNDGLDIRHGRAVSTPWGDGYVLTNPNNTTICLVAPGPNAQDWGASCASQSEATISGTANEYAYRPATHSARLIGLFPQGATVTMKSSGGMSEPVSLHHGVLSVDINQPEQLSVTIHGHTTIDHLIPKAANPVRPPTTGTSTSTTATATPTR